jgi:hypothetical protein
VTAVGITRARMRRENELACLLSVILRCPREARASKDDGPSTSAGILRGSLRSHLRGCEYFVGAQYSRMRMECDSLRSLICRRR